MGAARKKHPSGFAPYLPADLWDRTPLSYHRPRAAISLSRYEPSKSFKARNYTYKLRGGGGGRGLERFRCENLLRTERTEPDDATLCAGDNKCQPLFAQVLQLRDPFRGRGSLRLRYRREGRDVDDFETGDDQKFLVFFLFLFFFLMQRNKSFRSCRIFRHLVRFPSVGTRAKRSSKRDTRIKISKKFPTIYIIKREH